MQCQNWKTIFEEKLPVFQAKSSTVLRDVSARTAQKLEVCTSTLL